MTRQSFATFRALQRSTGVGLVTAIFLLVVLAGLGVAMVSIYTSQQATSTLDEQGARAYQAARAGVEWGLFQQMHDKMPCAGVVSPTSFALPANTSLHGFTVTVTCVQFGDDSDPLKRRVIRSTACTLQPPGGSCLNAANNNPDYVQRVLEVEI